MVIIPEQQKLEISEFLLEASKQSPAVKRKVAAVMFNPMTGSIVPDTLSINGLLDQKNLAYITTTLPCESKSDSNVTFNSVFHAEEQTIIKTLKKINAGGDCSGLILFCTFSPCYNCCRTIIMSGCKHIVYLEEHKHNFTCTEIIDDMSPKELLSHYGVTIELFEMPAKSNHKTKQATKNIVVYHSADLDGFASGYLLKKIITNTIEEEETLMFGYNYQAKHAFMQEIENNPEQQYHIYFGDVTPPLDWLIKIKPLLFGKNALVKISIFDHHAAALDKISTWYSNTISERLMHSDCNPMYCKDDIKAIRIITNTKETNHSGAKLIYDYFTWGYVLPNHGTVNFLIDSISLYDTWEFTKLPENKKLEIIYVHEYLTQFKTIEAFSDFLDNLPIEIDLLKEIYTFGKTIVKLKKAEAQKIFDSTIFSKILVNKIKHKVLVLGGVYPNYYLTEIIEDFMKHLDTPCCWISWNIDIKQNMVKFSVRAQNEGALSVLPICQYYRGGGHQKAGGFALLLDDGLKIISDFHKFDEKYK